MNYQSKVRLFQEASGQLVSDKPRELTKDELDFRDNLIREEYRELQDAIVDNNRIEYLDAICDVVYVALGTCNAMGVKHNFYSDDDYWAKPLYGSVSKLNDVLLEYIDKVDPSSIVSCCYDLAYVGGYTLDNFKTALDRVHESNMSKFCNDVKTAERTKEFYSKQGINTYIEPKEKKFVVYREGDGKVLKSVDYYPVYLRDLI